jgi:hypothetical protein
MKTKEQEREKNKKYHEAHKNEISLRKKRWALDNPEKVNKYKRDNPGYQNEYIKGHRRKHPEKYAAYARKRNYGVTQEWFEQKLKDQEGKCAICFSVLSKPSVDHNHKTRQPRGLLCHSCNVFVGFAHEDTKRLSSAIEYLRKYNGK